MAGLSAAGAAMGTAIMPGVGTAVGGLAGALADTFMGGNGGSASPSAPMNSQTAVYGSGLEGSGWAVNFSGVQSAASSPATASGIGLPAAGGALGSLGLSSIPSWFWLAAGGVLLWKKFGSK